MSMLSFLMRNLKRAKLSSKLQLENCIETLKGCTYFEVQTKGIIIVIIFQVFYFNSTFCIPIFIKDRPAVDSNERVVP